MPRATSPQTEATEAAPSLGAAASQDVVSELENMLAGVPGPAASPVGVTIPTVTIEIERDMSTKMEKTVFAHEVPVLQAIHKERVTLKSRGSVQVASFDPYGEFARMKQKYDRPNVQVVDAAYQLQGPILLAKLAGVPLDEPTGADVQAKMSSQNIRSREGQVLRAV